MHPEQKLESLGHTLAKPAAPAATYIPVSRIGNQVFVSGQVSIGPDGVVKGILGGSMDTAAGQAAAKLSALSILAHLKHSAGADLASVRLLKLTVLVASTPDFSEQHIVANGASDLLVEVLGDNGKHARAAFGVAALPLGAAVEIEAVAEILS